MLQKVKRVLVLCALGASLLVAFLLLKPSEQSKVKTLTGFTVADTIYMLAPVSGEVKEILVRRGQEVGVDEKLFYLDSTVQNAKLEQIRSDLKQFSAKSTYAETYLAQSQDNLDIAQAEVDKTSQDLKRYQDIWKKNSGAVSPLTMDHMRLAASTAQMQYNLAAKEVEAAKANIVAAKSFEERTLAEEKIALRNLAELSGYSPAEGRVEDILIQQGEWASTNAPVLSVVPHSKTRVRFYVPEKDLANYPIGTKLLISYTGAKTALQAEVSYIAPRAEFTPPIIYSLETSDKLVFCLEATPEKPESLLAGQPLVITRVSQ